MSENYLSEIRANAASITTSVRGVQKLAHDTVLLCWIHASKHKYDTSGFRILFNALENVKGSFRVQGLIDYCSEVFDLDVKEDKDKGFGYTVKRGGDKRINTAPQRRKALDYAKANPFYDWLPDEKPLKAPKLNTHWTIVPARGLATGEITAEEIEAEYGEFGLRKVKDTMTDPKIQEWAVKYLQQAIAA